MKRGSYMNQMTNANLGRLLATAAMLVVCLCLFAAPAFALDGSRLSASSWVQLPSGSKSVTSGTLTVSGLEDFGGVSVVNYAGITHRVILSITAEEGVTVTLTSSNPSMVVVNSSEFTSYGYEHYISCNVEGVGTAKVTVSDGANSIAVPIVCYPYDEAEPKPVVKAAYNTVRLSWTPVAGSSGYAIKRASVNSDGSVGSFTTIATVTGASASNATVQAVWNTEYAYMIVPYVAYGNSKFMADRSDGDWITYTLPQAAIALKSVARSGSKLKVSWSADAGATQYIVLRSTKEDRGFKKIATTKADSYADKNVKKGVTYYYRIQAVYSGAGTAQSGTFGQSLAKKAKFLRSFVKISQPDRSGAYGWNWASSDEVAYYTQGAKLYAVSYTGTFLKVYGFNASMKKVSTKTVSLPKHDLWGGFYHGPDGNNYVAIGYNNYKESKTKTVIKVIKFNESWKKGKTATIKGAASNVFTGIYIPFTGGVASFDMQGSTLYLFTCREMFARRDGLHHQSNIAFSIDVKTMKAKSDNIAYTSHSFNQRVKFKDGSIYLADHGDAYSRAICLKACGYSDDSATSWSATPFKFQGEVGNNYTGATMGGMEVGVGHVLVCGTAQPHGYKVAGVKGFGNCKQNVYLIVVDRSTGKSSVKWLSKINPRKGKQTVSEARIVKLSDDWFAVLYSIKNGAKGKETFHCTTVNDAGKVVSSKTYSNVKFTGSSQPVMRSGSICWIEKTSTDASTAYAIPVQ